MVSCIFYLIDARRSLHPDKTFNEMYKPDSSGNRELVKSPRRVVDREISGNGKFCAHGQYPQNLATY